MFSAASAVLSSLKSTQESGVLDVEVAEQSVDLTRACHTGLLDLMLARRPRLLHLLLFLLPPDGRQLFVVLELALQTLHHVLLLDALYLFLAVLAQALVLLEVQGLQVAFNDPDCPANEAGQLLLKRRPRRAPVGTRARVSGVTRRPVVAPSTTLEASIRSWRVTACGSATAKTLPQQLTDVLRQLSRQVLRPELGLGIAASSAGLQLEVLLKTGAELAFDISAHLPHEVFFDLAAYFSQPRFIHGLQVGRFTLDRSCG